jgi:YfiH family protein
VALAHAGWRGLAAGILEQTLADFPTPASETLVWLGPAIGPCHFEVGRDVRQAFLDPAGIGLREQLAACFKETAGSGKFLADLYQLARIKLTACGVGSISGGRYCTYCQEEQFYSFRRSQTTGRMASLIYLKP